MKIQWEGVVEAPEGPGRANPLAGLGGTQVSQRACSLANRYFCCNFYCNWKAVIASHFAKVFGSHKLTSCVLTDSRAIMVTLFSKSRSLNVMLAVQKMRKMLGEWRISVILINR